MARELSAFRVPDRWTLTADGCVLGAVVIAAVEIRRCEKLRFGWMSSRPR
jgi:hypothetical protein